MPSSSIGNSPKKRGRQDWAPLDEFFWRLILMARLLPPGPQGKRNRAPPPPPSSPDLSREVFRVLRGEVHTRAGAARLLGLEGEASAEEAAPAAKALQKKFSRCVIGVSSVGFLRGLWARVLVSPRRPRGCALRRVGACALCQPGPVETGISGGSGEC